MRLLSTVFALSIVCFAPAYAGPPPPDNSKPLSEIIHQIEQMPEFHYFDEVELEKEMYKVEYYTKDGVKHEVNIDPQTGKAR